GDSLRLLFDQAKGQNFFNADIDGKSRIVEVDEGSSAVDASFENLGNARHHLTLFKRTEASAGTVRFLGVEFAQPAHVWRAKAPAYKLRMEFIGDSITAGACNEDGVVDQWENHKTHNNALSYGAFTAAAFEADYRNIAVSGVGVVTGWSDIKAAQFWDRIYPSPSSRRADLSSWQPQVVFINFGENDDSFPRAHGQSFPEKFADGYVALVRQIRSAYPATHIVLLRGGMWGGSQSQPLKKAWESAVAQLEASDPAVSHFVFVHWSLTHPRVADHRAMADELIGWLKQQKFMQL
ncbi:MAG TPA: GDSL-type esterase/lipase family protein, partial [Tepidisphaeraceae bacterium]|nr:GDSL-type esterase/lipase family protein [Tepidisphaeraceae bacterium]